MMKFESYPEIGEKIFSYLDLQTLLNCQSVCQDWKEFLENPYFWLKKLKDVGQPEEIENAWKSLINKSTDFRMGKSIFAECLQMKFKDFILAQDQGKYLKDQSNFYLKCPPLFTAAYYGHIEIVKLIYHLGIDFNRKIYWKPPNRYNGRNCYEMPIFVAIRNGHNEVVKFIIDTPQEKLNPSVNSHGFMAISKAASLKNFDLVKFLVPKTTNWNHQTSIGYSLIHLALKDYRIFKLLISIPGINPNLPDRCGGTPLQYLCETKCVFDLSKEDIPKMVKILAPMADKKYLYSGIYSPIHRAAENGLIEVLEILVEYFDPNLENSIGLLPIDMAILGKQVEAVRFLATFTKELRIHERFRGEQNPSSALIEMISLIEERQKFQLNSV